MKEYCKKTLCHKVRKNKYIDSKSEKNTYNRLFRIRICWIKTRKQSWIRIQPKILQQSKSHVAVTLHQKEKPLYLFRDLTTNSVLFTVPSTFVGGKNLNFYPSLLYLWLSAYAAHLPVTVQMNSCLYETASFPGNQIVNEDEQLLPEQLITQWLLAAVHNFSARAPCLS